jgi:chemotaxis protein histidine kinase CheA
MMDIEFDENSNIIFAWIPMKQKDDDEDDEDDEDEDDEWLPIKKMKKKLEKNEKSSKKKPLSINIKNPRPVKNLQDFIQVLEDTVNWTTQELKSKEKTKTKETKTKETKTKETKTKETKTKTKTKETKKEETKTKRKRKRKRTIDDEDVEKKPKRSKKSKKPKKSKREIENEEKLKKDHKAKLVELDRVNDLISNLKELENMIGMKTIKQNIVNQLLLFIQNLNDPGMFLHTVLTGNAGCGKTTLANILAKIYKSMGFLETDNVIIADRPSLIGQWLGETSIKTKKVLDSAKGGVLLIDEAYSLGNEDGRDSFSKECIDTINQYLSENADELVCIIAGYKNELNKCFFNYNQGLARRFAWRYHIDNYTSEEMYDIIIRQLDLHNDSVNNWKLDVKKEYLVDLLTKHKNLFKHNGGDTKNFLEKCKISHAQRIFGSKSPKRIITKEDIKDALDTYIKVKGEHKEKNSNPPFGMYT